MKRQELYRRMVAIAQARGEPTAASVVRVVPFRDGVLVTVEGFGAWSLAARKAGSDEAMACDRAWVAIVARLTEEWSQSCAALSTARVLSDE